MAIDKIIPRSLNKDDDFLLVKSTEMVDALNISVSTDDDGDAGVIKRAYGNELVPFATGSALPAGTNKVVGSCINREKNEIMYAVYNSNSNHSIYLYSVGTNSLVLVDRDSVWGFAASSWVKMDTIVKENGDTLLYLNDGVTDPKKINVTKAVSSPSYPYKSIVDFEGTPIYSYTNEEKLLSLTVAKQPPLDPPKVTYVNDPSIKSNRLHRSFFQFACQYVYEDGEVSAISPYTEIAINSAQLFDGISSFNSSQVFNKINLSADCSLGDVAKVRFLARQSGTNQFFSIAESNNIRSFPFSVANASFSNGISKNFIQQRDQSKLYDNVPRFSNAQSIVSNRLLFGGVKEFYDTYTPQFSLNFDYSGQSSPSFIGTGPFSTPNTIGSVLGSGAAFWLNIDSLPAVSSKMYSLDFELLIKMDRIDISGSFGPFTNGISLGRVVNEDGFDVFSIKKVMLITPYTTIGQLASQIGSQIQGDYSLYSDGQTSWVSANPSGTYMTVGDVSVNISYSGYDAPNDELGLRIKVSNIDVTIASGGSMEQITASVANNNQSFVGITINSNSLIVNVDRMSGFKRLQSHAFGIFYTDNYNRSNAVKELGSFVPLWYSETNEYKGPSSAVIRLSGQAPSWAKRWHLVYSPYIDYSFCYTYSSAEAFTQSTVDDSGLNPIYVSLRHLEGKPSSYKESKSAIFNYSYVEGDRLRIKSYKGLDGSTVYPANLDFLVIGLDVFDSTNNSILLPSAPVSERKTGIFLRLKGELYSGFSQADIISGSSFWDRDCIFEIYRPTITPENKIYYEIGASGPVLFRQDTNQYVHGGERDFRFNTILFSLPQNRINVSSGLGKTNLDVRNGDIITISAGTFNIGNVALDEEGKKEFLIAAPDGIYTVSSINNLSDAVTNVYNGDVYYRPRQVKLNPLSGSTPTPSMLSVRYENLFVEDLSISDFYKSDFIGIGRPNASSNTAKEVFRKATLTWSDPYAIDTSILGLSSFNLSDANFSDLQAEHGPIRYIASNSDSIIVLQDTKCSVLPISRNVIEYADGSSGVTISNNFVGQQNFYAGDFGVGDHPESVAQYYGRVFFADPRTGKVIRISADGIELISDQGMEAFFDGLFETVNRLGSQNFKIYGGIDPRNGEYVISIQKISGAFEFENQTVGYSIDDKVWTTRYSYMPESISEINGELYTMKNGSLYRHSFGAPRCRFYGQDFPSSLRIISSQNGSMVKIFEALSQESTAPWSFSCSTIDQQTPVVLAANMDKREGFYYHSIPTDSSKIIVSGVGPAASFSAGSIGFSFPISYMPIAIGDQVYVISGSTATATGLSVTGVSEKAITVTGAGSVSAGNFIAVGSTDLFAVNGEKLRGPYMIVDLEITGTSDSELYAVNTWFNRSAQHNEMVN